MRKIIVGIFSTVLIAGTCYTAFASEKNSNVLNDKIENYATYKNNQKLYEKFVYDDMEIKLFPESTISKEEAIEKYPKAYSYIEKHSEEYNILVDLDSYEFQQYVKSYAIPTTQDETLNNEIKEFVKFMDIYENKQTNKKIIAALGEKKNNYEEIKELLPIQDVSTQPTDKQNGLDDFSYQSNGYSAEKSIQYAKEWWNKTNNNEYPYYASYYKQDTNSNDFNDLDENSQGQSLVRRNWSDCTNFVSQCLKFGGMEYRKSGLILPYRQEKNWYYDNSKPSHTWGGAQNFYEHWKNRAGVAESSSFLSGGDVISVDFTSDGDIDHTAIITSNKNYTDDTKLLTQHSFDRCEILPDGTAYSLAYLYSQEYKIYGYEMDKAPIK